MRRCKTLISQAAAVDAAQQPGEGRKGWTISDLTNETAAPR